MPEPIRVDKILDRAAFFLNDTDRTYYTNLVLLEPLKVAFDDLKEELEDNSISIAQGTSGPINVNVGTTVIGGELPNDIVEPLEVWERLQGSSDDYTQMVRKDFLPKTDVLVNDLIYWVWDGLAIKFLGALTDREVKVDYVAAPLGSIEGVSTILQYLPARSFLSYRTAAHASGFLGEDDERETKLNVNAQLALDKLLNLNIKAKQSITTRRRPFRARYKARQIT